MSNFEFELIGSEHKKRSNLLPYPVVVGDGNTPCNILDPDIPGNILVRYVVSQNLFQPISVGAPTSKMDLSPGKAVELEHDNYGNLRIKGYDNKAAIAAGDFPYASVVDSDKSKQQDMATLLPQPTQPTATTKVLIKGWNPIVNGVAYEFSGGEIDIATAGGGGSSLIPTSGNMAYIVIFVKNDYLTLEAKTSTPRPLTDDDLGIADINEAIALRTAGSTPVWAIPLSNAQSTITQTDIDSGADLRNVVNNLETAGTTGTVTSVAFTAAPSGVFDVAGSPITSSGTIALSMDNQSANQVLAGPSSGGAATPAFRALVDDDIPAALTLVGGSINNTPIGASTANTGRFTTIEANGTITLIITTKSVILTHAGTADATVTLPSLDVTLIGYNASSQVVVPVGTKFMPASDSTTALILAANAAGTALLTVDTTNQHFGFGINPTTVDHISTSKTFADIAATSRGVNLALTHSITSNNAQAIRGLSVTATINQGSVNATSATAAVANNLNAVGSGASGTVTGVVAQIATAGNTGAGIVTNAYAYQVGAALNSGGGTLTNFAAWSSPAQTTATNNTYILIGTTTIPSGSWAIHSTTANNSALNGRLAVGTTTAPTAMLQVVGKADEIQAIVRGFSSQTANLQEWQNSGGSALIVFGADGSTAWGTTISSIIRHRFLHTTNSTGASLDLDNILLLTHTVDTANSYTASNHEVRIQAASSANFTRSAGSGGLIASAAIIRHLGTGTLTLGTIQSTFADVQGPVTTLVYYDLIAPSVTGSGTIGTLYGLRIGSLTAGTTNYALFANAGRVSVLGSETIASAAGATWGGIEERAATATLTGSTNITAAAGFNYHSIARPTLSAASALTVTNAATLYIANAPAGGGAGPATITNPYALWIDAGNTRLDGLLGVGDIVLPSARVHIVEPTLGNAVQTLSSTATNDDPTETVYQNRTATTDATVTTLHTFTVPASTTYYIHATVVARRTGGTGGTAEDGAGYEIIGTYKNVSGTATLIGAVSALYTAEDQAGWNATFDTTGATVRVRITGAADNNISWHMTARVYPIGS